LKVITMVLLQVCPACNTSSVPFCAEIFNYPAYKNLTIYDVILAIAVLSFAIFLLLKAKTFRSILTEMDVPEIKTFLGFIITVSLVNIAHLIIDIFDTDENVFWTIVWILTRAALVFLEFGVIVLLIFHTQWRIWKKQGKRWEVLKLTIGISGTLTFIDVGVMIGLIFGLNNQIWNVSIINNSNSKITALFWVARSFIMFVTYPILLFFSPQLLSDTAMHTIQFAYSSNGHVNVTQARMVFIRYIVLLMVLNGLEFIGWSLLYFELDAGICVIGFSLFLYYAAFPPVVYLSFMANFFSKEEHWPLLYNKDDGPAKIMDVDVDT